MMQDELDLLIIDDDEGILALLTETFAEQGLTIAVANSIQDARNKLARHSFKVVLSDHNLTDGNGVDFLAELGGWGVKSVPILMTGLPDSSVAIDAINRGKVFKFATKPLDLMALTLSVRRAKDYYTSQLTRETMTYSMFERTKRLAQETEAQERKLQLATQRIRNEERTVERQRAQIETLYTEIQKAYLHTVMSLTAAIEAKDRYTKGHSDRVFHYCILMADTLGLPESSRTDLRFASVLHDLGKIGISDTILLKPGKLTEEEHRVMATHPELTDDILRPLPFLDNVRKIIREHHERFDGQGYPNGLKAAQISLEGRILAVADAYDAMRSDRAYRKALSRSKAIEELQQESGAQFCPLCVGALVLAVETHDEKCKEASERILDVQWEEEFLRLRPAAEQIPIETVNN
jgi:HD-GYP domain-containing protein (c-di-GMP phosphodiesterase class II)